MNEALQLGREVAAAQALCNAPEVVANREAASAAYEAAQREHEAAQQDLSEAEQHLSQEEEVDAMAASLRRDHSEFFGGMLVFVPTDKVDDVTALVLTVGLEATLWDNGTPYRPEGVAG